MKCPNCNFEFSQGYICPNCNADVTILKKSISASVKLYNKGLSQAKEGCYTQACETLNESLMFYKKNYMARNLLGLVYFEIGCTADALKQWIISSSLVRREDNPARKYIDSFQKDARTMEKYNDAVRMYNNAIRYARQGSGDLAVIQLKKAIDFNPKLVMAYNLLSLCYMIGNEPQRAERLLRKVLSLDKDNPVALRYLNELNPQEQEGKKETPVYDTAEKEHRNNKTYVRRNKQDMIKRMLGEAVFFLAGVICTAAVLMTLVVPAWVENKDQQISDLTAQVQEFEATQTAYAASSSDTATLQAEIERLTAENNEYKQKEALQAQIDKIAQAVSLNESGDVEGAAAIIAEIDDTGMGDTDRATLNTLRETVIPEAAQSFYNSGRSHYLNGELDLAATAFENALKFASGEDFVDDSIYYLGSIAEDKGDLAKARTYYERIINEYPNSNQYRNAENSLNNMNETQ